MKKVALYDKICNSDCYVLEFNHDPHVLMASSRPLNLKRRILSEHGHLSNEASGRLLCEILHDKLEHIVLGHLSKENNYPDLARETVKLEVTMGKAPFKGEEIPLMVASRDSISNILYV